MHENNEETKNKEFLDLKQQHANLLIEFEKLKNATVTSMKTQDDKDEAGGTDEKLIKLKKKVMQEKKKSEKLQQENELLKIQTNEQIERQAFNNFSLQQ